MLLKSKKICLIPAVFLLFLSFVLFLSPVLATAPSDQPYNNYGMEDTIKKGDVGDALISANVTPTDVAGTVVSAILSLVGVVFFLLILYGGLRWMIAQGNDSEVEKAKQILIAATVGLIIVLAAYAITTFIGNFLTT